MNLFLLPNHQNIDSLKREFFNISHPGDLATLLEVDFSKLTFLLYGERKYISQYRRFEVNKKNGKKRIILAPISSIKILQKKLNLILQDVYIPNSSAQGFIKNKNVITNASVHVGKKNILNIDLKGFFPSINFGRVRGLFMGEPFRFDPDVATVLAQLCCYEGVLPQGAPTSPVISNMLCVRLDKQLRKLAHKTNSSYTRYADDITFSTDRNSFHDDIAKCSFVGDVIDISLSDKLKEIITANGFEINYEKVHFATKERKKQVTGLVVNKKVNVSRLYIRRIRSMLHAWQKFGITAAQDEYYGKYKNDNRLLNNHKDYRNVIKGRIDFIGQVRGRQDYIYRKLYNWFNQLDGSGRPPFPTSFEEELEQSLFVIECGSKQGTGFLLKGVGLVTCNHVVDASRDITVYQVNTALPSQRLKATVKYRSSDQDLALLDVSFSTGIHYSALNIANQGVKINSDLVTCIGFADHKPGESYQKNTGLVQSIRKDKRGTPFYAYSNNLAIGQSGGPALNSRNEVIGVVVTGSDNPGVPARSAEMGILTFEVLKDFIAKAS